MVWLLVGIVAISNITFKVCRITYDPVVRRVAVDLVMANFILLVVKKLNELSVKFIQILYNRVKVHIRQTIQVNLITGNLIT